MLTVFRRAYCARADGVWPPIFVALSYWLCSYKMPFLLLLPLLFVIFVGGMYLFCVVLAGELNF